MSTIDKRVINARYVHELIQKYGEEYPSADKVLRGFLEKRGYNEKQIESIIEEVAIENTVDAMQFGDFLSTVEDVMASFAHIEYKEYGEIAKRLEQVVAAQYGVSDVCVDIYGDLRSALRILERVGKIEKVDNPYREGSFVYKYKN